MMHPEKKSADAIESYRIVVDGMSCQHCAGAVEQAVRSVAGVKTAEVMLQAGYVAVTGGSPSEVVAAIKAAGYEPSLPPGVPHVIWLSEVWLP